MIISIIYLYKYY